MFLGEDSRWEQQFRRERVKQRLPVSARRVNPQIVGVLITGHEVAEFVGSGSTAAAWIAFEAHDCDRYITVDHRCAFPGNIGHQDILPSTLTQLHERFESLQAQAQLVSDPQCKIAGSVLRVDRRLSLQERCWLQHA